MKNYNYYIKIGISIILIIIAIYVFVKINFIFSIVDGKMYDGFGTEYVNNHPNSKYNIIGYICIISGISLFLETNKKHAKHEQLEELNKNK